MNFKTKLINKLGYIIASLIILMALLASITNLLTPVLNAHRADFEKLASEKLHMPVVLKQVKLGWFHLSPHISLEHLTILDSTEKPKISIQRLDITLSLWRSLLNWRIYIKNLTLSGASLAITQKASGSVQVGNLTEFNMTDTMTGASVEAEALFSWIYSQPRLALKNIEISYLAPHRAPMFMTVNSLTLRNTEKQHLLVGSVILHQEAPTTMRVSLSWKGDVRNLPAGIGYLSVDVDKLSLPQWFGYLSNSEVQVINGLASTKLSIFWQHNKIQTVEGTFNIYDLEMYSKILKNKRIVNVAHLNGSFNWNNEKATLLIDSKNTFLTLKQIFAQSIYIQQLRGILSLKKEANGAWTLQSDNLQMSNADLSANAKLLLTLPINDTPVIDLSADFAVTDVGNISHYLPLQIFDPDLKIWLSNAFISGQVESGKAIIKGKLADFPFEKNTGEFKVTGELKNVDFNYAPGWPHLLRTDGTLTFAGSAMTANVRKGQIAEIPVTNIVGEIPYLGANGPQVVKVKGLIQSDFEHGLAFIQNSPLHKTIGRDLRGLNVIGPLQLDLDLSVPLGNPDDTKVNGNVSFSNALLTVPAWKLFLEKLQGSFRFTESEIESKQMQGQMFNEPLLLNIATLHDGKESQVKVDLASRISIPILQKWLGMSLTKVVDGSTNYQAELLLASHDQAPAHHIIVSSDLNGIGVQLPVPYGKKPQELTNFKIAVDVTPDKLLKTKLTYNNALNVMMNYRQAKKGFELLGDIVLESDVLTVYGIPFHQAHVEVSQSADAWQLNIDSKEIAGKLNLPFNTKLQPIKANLQRLYINSSMINKNNSVTKPALFPELWIDVNDLQYNDAKLGHVMLNTAPIQNGLMIKRLHIDDSLIKFDATGTWLANGGQSTSHMQGDMSTSELSEVLRRWGFSTANFVGKTAGIHFDLNWPKAPYSIEMETLSGNVSLNMGEGRILELSESSNAKMGLGRLLNLFSLSTIPRRLSLDFSDLFEKGYSFDFLKANFTLNNGNAFTNDMRFDGPVAGIKIKGRIGLQAKDIDLTLDVSPHVTGSLPVVAAIAGGPVVGVATYVVDRFVSKAVSQVSTYQYHVSGPWDKPIWNQLSTKK